MHSTVSGTIVIASTATSSNCKYFRHGLSKHPLHMVWKMIKRRCYKPKATRYELYGGMGVKMCDDWKCHFLSFYNWAIENGWESGLQVDRFPDNNGDYQPNNCRIATRKQNVRSRRNTTLIEYQLQIKPLAEWCDIYNISYNHVNGRLRKGWGIEKALLTPININ